MIRQPRDSDLPELISLWQEAFGDAEEEAAFYFRLRHRHGNMLVMEKEGRIAGMLSMLPVTLTAKSFCIPGRYVFAVATKKENRGQGISTALLDAAHEAMRREGTAVSLLVPADDGLYAFYRKRGYQTAFYLHEIILSAEEISPSPATGEVSLCGADEYFRIRSAAFTSSKLFAQWDRDALEFVRRSAEASGGALLRLRAGNAEAAAVCEVREGIVRVSELALDGFIWRDAMALIHRHFKAERYILRLPEGMLGRDSLRPFGMIRWLREPPQMEGSPPWLALAKD